MAYDVDNIIPIIINLTPQGLGFANFSSAVIFARQNDLASGASFPVDTFKDYSSLPEVAQDFDTSSDTYYMATRWFANLPTPPQITVFMWDDVSDTVEEAANKFEDLAWRYFHFWPADVVNVEANAIALADWADANEHYIPICTSAANIVDPLITTDLASVLNNKGNRRISVCYKDAASVATDPTQIYAGIQLCAAFYKFRPNADRTAITGEYQVLAGVSGDDLSTTAYNALKAKNAVFFTQIELKGSIDGSRVINSKSTSNFGEFMDDVINLDVLKNYLQVNGYNYIANAGTKRPLDPNGYAGLLSAFEDTCKQFYNNGVLGEGEYIDPVTGEEEIARFGYVINSSPEDVFSLTPSQRKARQYPSTNITAVLSRAGHTAEVVLNVE